MLCRKNYAIAWGIKNPLRFNCNYWEPLARQSGRITTLEQANAPAAEVAALRDDELVALIARRQEQALGAIYDRYGRLVYAVALRITGDRQTAEEVVQDVFQNIWHSAAGFQSSVGSFSSWLMGITRHRAIDATRSRRERARNREQELTPEVDSGAAGRIDGPEDVVARRLLREQIRSALGVLPPPQRHAIELAYFGGLTRNEIAEKLGEPVGTVKTRLRLGLLKLRDLLADV